MTSITFYGGVSTIGGNCVVIEENDTRIMIDNGMCFAKENAYYKDFLYPRSNNDIRDYLELGLVPEIPGIYGEDKINDIYLSEATPESKYLFKTEITSYEEYLEENDSPYISALFLSHCHLDHARNIKFMHPDIPIYCSAVTQHFLNIISDLSDDDFLHYCFAKTKERTNRSYFPDELYKNKCYEDRIIKTINPENVIDIPDNEGVFQVKGHPVDHSVLGGMAFEIFTKEGKSIIYTGDIRFHGNEYGKKKSNAFLENITPNPDALISEGTRIDDDTEMSEHDVNVNMTNMLKRDTNLSKKLIMASFPWKSISRFKTLYEVSKELNRILVIQPKLAYTLYHLQSFEPLNIKNILTNEDLKIYLPRKSSMIYSMDDYKSTKFNLSYSTDWNHDEEIELYSTKYGENIHLKAYEIKNNPSGYILHLNFYNLNELIDLQPPEGSYLFNLKTEPFNERGELEEKVLLNWITKFNLQYEMEDYHASGHASGKDIRKMIKKVAPKRLFPVHTERPDLFEFKNAEIDIEKGKKYII